MEELSVIGEKHKRILVAFLKMNNAYSSFFRNYYEGNMLSRMNDRLNNEPLEDLFGAFFALSWCEHPSTLKTHFDRYVYWSYLFDKWRTFCYYSKYKDIIYGRNKT